MLSQRADLFFSNLISHTTASFIPCFQHLSLSLSISLNFSRLRPTLSLLPLGAQAFPSRCPPRGAVLCASIVNYLTQSLLHHRPCGWVRARVAFPRALQSNAANQVERPNSNYSNRTILINDGVCANTDGRQSTCSSWPWPRQGSFRSHTGFPISVFDTYSYIFFLHLHAFHGSVAQSGRERGWRGGGGLSARARQRAGEREWWEEFSGVRRAPGCPYIEL